LLRDREARRPVGGHLFAQSVLDHQPRQAQIDAELLRRLLVDQAMRVAVAADLVAGVPDGSHQGRLPLRHPAEHEEGRSHSRDGPCGVARRPATASHQTPAPAPAWMVAKTAGSRVASRASRSRTARATPNTSSVSAYTPSTPRYSAASQALHQATRGPRTTPA